MIYIFNKIIFAQKKLAMAMSLVFILFYLLSSAAVLAAQQNNIAVEDCASVVHIKNMDEFKYVGKKPGGHLDGGIYILKSEPNAQYLIKFVGKNGVLNELVGAFILRKLIGDRAPLNYIVRLKNGDIAIASKFIKDFVGREYYADELAKTDQEIAKLIAIKCLKEIAYEEVVPAKCKTNNLAYRELYYSKEVVEANLLANFIGHGDYENNMGFVIKDGSVFNTVIIDFEILDHSPLPFAAPKKYFAGIDQVLQSLELISSFNTNCLDELYPLFDQLGERPFLDEIKKALNKRLIHFGVQIKACKLVKKLTAEDFTEEDLDQLIDLGHNKHILPNFTLENGENILIDFLCSKNDVSRIAMTLSIEEELVPTFVRYCLKNNKHELLHRVISSLDESVSNKIMNEYLCRLMQQPKKHDN